MLLLSRKVSSLSITSSSSSLISVSLSKLTNNIMASTTTNNTQSRLAVLSQQLRLYKPPVGLDGDDDKRASLSQVGFPESVTSAGNQSPEKFSPKRAAVLICLFQGKNDDGLRVILTKRSSGLSTHSGEVSLPGGKAEEEDVDDADTATREAKEEIGLNPSLVNVVTILEPFLSKVLLHIIMSFYDANILCSHSYFLSEP
ncbi:hypothetical protein OSB04_002656 [Centaurea solstitialis]|uniref:Nudix hydrolase domain-containing protein n=1 Tax=Centaurea solstitialis TaxID=347529 RepID=A0AA38WTC0_9ASTR|nr:hypothetical protein OSB04_002656 [Centaurea solstitialis]